VDRLEEELQERAEVIRLDAMTGPGMGVIRRYGVRVTPTLFVFDGDGNIVLTQQGIPDRDAVLTAVADLTG
jgi:hypothetical protein